MVIILTLCSRDWNASLMVILSFFFNSLPAGSLRRTRFACLPIIIDISARLHSFSGISRRQSFRRMEWRIYYFYYGGCSAQSRAETTRISYRGIDGITLKVLLSKNKRNSIWSLIFDTFRLETVTIYRVIFEINLKWWNNPEDFKVWVLVGN